MAWGLAGDSWFAFLTKGERPVCTRLHLLPEGRIKRTCQVTPRQVIHENSTSTSFAEEGETHNSLALVHKFSCKKVPDRRFKRVSRKEQPAGASVRFSTLLSPGQRGSLSLPLASLKAAQIGISAESPGAFPPSALLKGHVFGARGSRRNWNQKGFSAQSQFYSRIHVLVF